MISISRPAWFALLAFAFAGIGCEQASDNNPSGVNPQPEVADKAVPSETKPIPVTTKPSDPVADKKEAPGAQAAAASQEAATSATRPDDKVKLEKVKYDEFRKRIVNKSAKYTVVDCWATWCGPCKENFPHLVTMSKKYGGKGLAVASVSFDDPSDAKQVKDAETFLKAKNADFPNYLLDEGELGGFDKFDLSAIPAVFIYNPDGKEVKRFTLDDPNNQFTYDEVEQVVVALLDGKPLPKTEPAKPAKAK